MEDLRLPAVAARLVAWHNRHPLARRITAAQVHAVGYVALPFVLRDVLKDVSKETSKEASSEAAAAPHAAAGETGAAGAAGGSLRERALACARQPESATLPMPDIAAAAAPHGPLQPDFSENFIDPLTPRQVARFAAKAGQPLARAPSDAPTRLVRADGTHPGRAAVPLYLLTAAIETGIYKSRVLLGGGAPAAVLGHRIWSRPRIGALLGVLTLSVLGLVMALRPAAPHGGVPMAAAAAAAPAPAPAPAPAATALAATHVPALNVAAVTHANAPAPGDAREAPRRAEHTVGRTAEHTSEPRAERAVASAIERQAEPATAHRAERPAARPAAHGATVAQTLVSTPVASPAEVAASTPGRMALPSIRPQLSEEAKAAARQARAGAKAAATASLPAAPAVRAAMPSTLPGTQPGTLFGTQPTIQLATQPAAPTFALSTRRLRTRAEADQVQVAMQSLLKTVGANPVKVDVLAEGDDWRVVGWPFGSRTNADKARALLVSRGMRVQVVGF